MKNVKIFIPINQCKVEHDFFYFKCDSILWNKGFGFRFEYIQFIMTMSEELGVVSGGGQGNSAQDKQDIMMQLTLFIQGIIKSAFPSIGQNGLYLLLSLYWL